MSRMEWEMQQRHERLNVRLFKEMRSGKALHRPISGYTLIHAWYNYLREVHAVFSFERKVIRVRFDFSFLCSVWLEKLVPLSQPIGNKNKTNRDICDTRAFPRLTLVTCICFEFWLVHCLVRLFCLLRLIILTLNWKMLDTCDNICDVVYRQCDVIFRQDSRISRIKCELPICLEQFSNECLKTNFKVITLTNNKRNKT